MIKTVEAMDEDSNLDVVFQHS